jgi:tetratricopeptide (TPR) repeat protein
MSGCSRKRKKNRLANYVSRTSFLVPFAALLIGSVSLAQEAKQLSGEKSADAKRESDLFMAGRSAAKEQRYDDAVREFQAAIAINSKNKLYYDNLGYCMNKLRRYDKAIEALNHSISLDAKNSYAYRELGISFCGKQQPEKAIEFLRQAVSLNQSDVVNRRWLGYALYQAKQYDAAVSALDEALKLRPDNFDANYWRGVSLFKLSRFDDADQSLAKAASLRPNDFNANFWRGISLVRVRKFKDAVSSFERAHEVKPDDQAARLELFACYLASNQTKKAASVYPHLLLTIGGFLAFVYVVWFATLLPFSLPIRDKTLPGFWFSLAWLGLFIEGQGAFLLLLASFPSLGLHETVLTGVIVAGLPIMAVALMGFARQPWGEPFRWPPRFGDPKTILISILLIFGTVLIANLFAQLYGYVTNKSFPLQRTIPLIRNALQANPVVAWVGIALVIPCVEEILFRGLLFGAFQKMWGITGAVVGSSVIFVLVHLQLVGFLALFLLGLILAWARLRSGSLGLPIALHALNNSMAMLLLTFAPPPSGA